MRKVSKAALVCKRGPMGAAVFEGEIPDSLDKGQTGPGFPIEVFNVLGAGDGFMAVFEGLADGRELADGAEICQCLRCLRGVPPRLHACLPKLGRTAVFLCHGHQEQGAAQGCGARTVHWSTNRKGDWSTMRVFRLRSPHAAGAMAEEAGVPTERIGAFKKLCLQAATTVAGGQGGYGILCDGRLGKEALYAAAGTGLWIGRPAEWPGSRPLTLEPELGLDCGGLGEWAAEHVVKVLCFYHPDDTAEVKRSRKKR